MQQSIFKPEDTYTELSCYPNASVVWNTETPRQERLLEISAFAEVLSALCNDKESRRIAMLRYIYLHYNFDLNITKNVYISQISKPGRTHKDARLLHDHIA